MTVPSYILPAWAAEGAAAFSIDVRPILTEGGDPLSRVLPLAGELKPGETLLVETPFNPSPMRRLLRAQGFSSFGVKAASDHWRIFFHLDGGGNSEGNFEPSHTPGGAALWTEEDGPHMDVRGMAPPQPMVAILSWIDANPRAAGLLVHHDRHPQYLLPELAERGWHLAAEEQRHGHLMLRLEPVAP